MKILTKRGLTSLPTSSIKELNFIEYSPSKKSREKKRNKITTYLIINNEKCN